MKKNVHLQNGNRCKRVLEAAKLAYANNGKESITSQKLGSRDFLRSANSVLNKGKSAMLLLLNGPEVLTSSSDKAKLFAKNSPKNSNLDDSRISLPIFPSRTNLKLHNISVTPMMVKKVIMNLVSSKTSGPDCIPVVVLKTCEPKLSYILAKLYNNCLKDLVIQIVGRCHRCFLYLRMLGKRYATKNYHPVNFFFWGWESRRKNCK